MSNSDVEIVVRVLLLLVLVFPSFVSAAYFSGADLLHSCEAVYKEPTTTKMWMERAQCYGYVMGAMDAYQGSVGRGEEPIYCKPSGVQTVQVARIVLKFFRNNPEILHQAGDVAVLVALSEAFPPIVKEGILSCG